MDRRLNKLKRSVAFTLLSVAAITAMPAPSHAQRRRTAAEILTLVRSEHVTEDSRQAGILLGWGIGSMLAGGYLALTAGSGNRELSVALNNVAWGAINTAIAIPWFLGTRRELAAIDRDRALSGEALLQAHREAIERSERQARTLWINAVIDVAYVGGGIFAWAMSEQNIEARDFWAGVGITAVVQGAFLFAFDLIGWRAADARTDRLRRLRLGQESSVHRVPAMVDAR
jgi:hypothetical protein